MVVYLNYGAEQGEQVPLWDQIKPEITIFDGIARTGQRSMRMYQVPPPKTFNQMRVHWRYGDTGKKVYFSWWAYFPSDQDWEIVNPDPGDWGTALGGLQTFFGPTGAAFRHFTSARWVWENRGGSGYPAGRYLKFVHLLPFGVDDTNDVVQTRFPNINLADYLDQWIHFEVETLWTLDDTGYIKAWFNDQLLIDVQNVRTDPRGYQQWIDEECNFTAGNGANPSGYEGSGVTVELYQPANSPERWYYIDDMYAGSEPPEAPPKPPIGRRNLIVGAGLGVGLGLLFNKFLFRRRG